MGIQEFDGDEAFNLNDTFIKFIVPRLVFLRNNLNSHPYVLSMEEWEKILDKMIEGFEVGIKEDFNCTGFTKRDIEKINKSLDLFKTWFFYLDD